MHRSSAQSVSFAQRSVGLLSTLAGYGVLAAALFVAPAVQADIIQTFNLAWSGTSYGNTASAVGSITLDETLLGPSGQSDVNLSGSTVSALSVTISGAGAGNGTFTLADFGSMYMYINSGTFDFTKQLVGQTANGGGWGSSSSTGDFNLFSNGLVATAPYGYNYFDLAADDGNSAYQMKLTSFTAAPEPSSIALLGLGVLGVGFLARRRRAI
jgi:PEP-CTERM motif-containing protein